MDHVKQLVQSIRANGGLTDPLIVQDGEFVVFEGNSRLAAYRLLARLDPLPIACENSETVISPKLLGHASIPKPAGDPLHFSRCGRLWEKGCHEK